LRLPWEVYEQILRVPYYFLFDRYENCFRGFGLNHSRYQPLDIEQQKIWLPELNLGLGVWQGTYQGVTRPWLRWYDVAGQWIPTPAELNQQERQRAEQAEQQVYQIARNLAQTGMAIADIATITGLSAEQVRSLLEA
jgi:hypothetical protein